MVMVVLEVEDLMQLLDDPGVEFLWGGRRGEEEPWPT
jgi:hypothetical protein